MKFATKTEKRDVIIDYLTSAEEWIVFWRENVHRFVQDYFQVQTKEFQDIVVYEMSKNRNIIIIATRGIGKSFLTALYACAMAVLYPNSKIVVVCENKAQAKGLIGEKIEQELCSMSVMLKNEIKEFKSESEFKKAIFKNGSVIIGTNASENRRGLRATMLIIDEAVHVDKKILESVLQPFLNATRRRGFDFNPKYKNNIDPVENQSLYLTSAWYKAHYFYNVYYLDFIKSMLKDENYRVFNFSYETSVRTRLLAQTRVDDLKRTQDAITFSMESESIFYGSNADAFFSADELNSRRISTEIFYPPTQFEYLTHKETNTWKYEFRPKAENEMRVLACDIAIMSGKSNDNSIYTLATMKNKNEKTHITVNHMESHNGLNPESQAILIKRLFYDFECDRMIIDAHGVGMAVFNELGKETVDTERGITYPKWETITGVNKNLSGLKMNGYHYVMYPMKATLESNHTMIMQLKACLTTGCISLPLNEIDANKYLEDTYDLSCKSPDEQVRLLMPYKEISLFFNEIINLTHNLVKGKIQVKETGSARKDRFSSLAYCVYLCFILAEDFKKSNLDTECIFFS